MCTGQNCTSTRDLARMLQQGSHDQIHVNIFFFKAQPKLNNKCASCMFACALGVLCFYSTLENRAMNAHFNP